MSHRKHKYTTEQLIHAVKVSFSKREVLLKLGIVAAGGNYTTIGKEIKKYNLDTSHFHRECWNKGQNIGPKRPISDYLMNRFPISSHALKKRLLREGLFPHQCHCCLRTRWMGKPIPLELHHKDGDQHNNLLFNLSLLCPNCHTFTINYRIPKQNASGGT